MKRVPIPTIVFYAKCETFRASSTHTRDWSSLASPLIPVSYRSPRASKSCWKPYTALKSMVCVWVYSPGNITSTSDPPRASLERPEGASFWNHWGLSPERPISPRPTRNNFSWDSLLAGARDDTIIVCLSHPIRNPFIPLQCFSVESHISLQSLLFICSSISFFSSFISAFPCIVE